MGTQTRTYSPRERNKQIVELALRAHEMRVTTAGGSMFYCVCQSQVPMNEMSPAQVREHLAEKIVQAQNEWVRSL